MGSFGLSVTQVSDEYLFEHVLPPLRHEIDIERICSGMKRRRVLKSQGKGRYGWNGINKTKKRSCNNCTTLKGALTGIFSALISEVNSELSSNTLEIVSDGNQICLSEDFNLDSALLLSDAMEKNKSRRYWYDIAVPISFSKNSTFFDTNDIEQVISCMQHVMASDLCRRFVYGIHMSNTTMHLCFFSRSPILLSNEFDLNTDYRSVIRILLSLLYASKFDLGWDSSISTDIVDGVRHYTMDISGVRITTNDTLKFDLQKECSIIGSGAHTYKAHKNVKGKDAGMVVLKDYWLEDGRKSEVEIRNALLEDMTNPDDGDYVDKHVLSCLAYEQVKVDGVMDHTERVMLRGKSPDYSQKLESFTDLVNARKKAKASVGAEGSTYCTRKITEDCENRQRERHSHRTHYRILYNEIATPFCGLINSKDIMGVLVDVVETLLRIHREGWVHHAISTENIYLYVDPETGEKRGMIGGLQFARKVENGARYDVRTGALDFMAIEVASGKYLFTKRGTGNNILSRMDAYENEQTSSDAQMNVGSGFCNNYIHDLGSVWWITVWMVFSFEKAMPIRDDILDPMASSTRSRHRKTLFEALSPTDRQESLSVEGDLEASVKGCIPRYFTDLVIYLRASREEIVFTYEREEVDKPTVITFKESDDGEDECLHKTLLSALHMTRNYMRKFDIVFVPSSGSK